MAVAAYAAVVSLMNLLDQIQDPAPQRLPLDRNQIKTLRENVSFLHDFLKVHSQIFRAGLKGLARRIAEVAVEAEDIINTHVVDILISQSGKVVADESEEYIGDSLVMDQLHEGYSDKRETALSFFCDGIENVIGKIESIKKELITLIKEEVIIQEHGPGVFGPARATAPHSSGKNTMVGFDERLIRIMDELVGDKRDLQVLSIVGMGGIGKTTLARNAFDSLQSMPHFDLRIWLTVSQANSMHGILLGLLEKPDGHKNEENSESLAELGDLLHKHLFDRRYLIVLDDVWSIEVWKYIRSYFPNNKNGSRVMVTTRLTNIAASFGSNSPFLMDFLDEDQSWNLFCKHAFAKDDCPLELEEIGKGIARSCRGLPLALVVIGGMLSKSNMTLEHWEFIAKDVNSFANSEDDKHCLKLLSLSYNHLPIHLKPCFLSMRLFPEDCEIEVNQLIIMWVVEGFLEPLKDKTLEEVAQEYLEDLIGRNLMICKWEKNGKTKRCGVHDLLRDLCIRESQIEQFNCVPITQRVSQWSYGTSCFLCMNDEAELRRISLPRATVTSEPTSLGSCLVCDGCRIKFPQPQEIRLVKVLENRVSSYLEILHPTKLRFLGILAEVIRLDSLNLLWNLQTLVMESDTIFLPPEIWELSQIRHLKVTHVGYLPNPLPITQVSRKDPTIILKNLQTLSYIGNFSWSEAAIERVPNLKTLEVNYCSTQGEKLSSMHGVNLSDFSLHNLGRLHKLESLTLDAAFACTLKDIAFPNSLKELTFTSGRVPWEEITVIGLLPNLEELTLQRDAFEGREWNPIEGQFLRLKSLTISENRLVRWGAEKIHFPVLEHLKLQYMQRLEKIPPEIGEIGTLHSIYVRYCWKSIVNSAIEILEEQHSFGNEDFQLYVDGKLVLPSSG